MLNSVVVIIGIALGFLAEVGLWKFCDWFIHKYDLEDAADS